MFWGCFSYHGLSKLVVVDETMNAEKYKNVLEHHLVPELRNFNSEIVFMQDNAPCHKARTVLQFFVDHGITVMDWPAQSPDCREWQSTHDRTFGEQRSRSARSPALPR